MKVYTYSEARQRLSEVLDIARGEEVVIKRRGGETYSVYLKHQQNPLSMFPELNRKLRHQISSTQSKNQELESKGVIKARP